MYCILDTEANFYSDGWQGNSINILVISTSIIRVLVKYLHTHALRRTKFYKHLHTHLHANTYSHTHTHTHILIHTHVYIHKTERN